MPGLILKKFEKEDVDYIKGKKLYLISYFPSYITELYERYGYDGEIAGVFDLDEDKYGEKEVNGQSFVVSDINGIKNCPGDSVLMITTGYFEDEFHRLEFMEFPGTVDKTVYFFANLDIDGIIEADNVISYDISFPALTRYMSSEEAMINPAAYFGFRPSVQYTWVKNMAGDEASWLKECGETTKQAIRGLANDDRYSVFRPKLNEKSLDEFYRMHTETYVRTNHDRLLIDRGYYEYIWYTLAKENVVSVFFCRDNDTGDSIASVITINFDNTSYYWYGASLDDIDWRVNRYLLWKAMLQCKEEYETQTGRDDFVFETGAAFPYLRGGKEKGISDYKRSFATRLYIRHVGEYVMMDDPQELNES